MELSVKRRLSLGFASNLVGKLSGSVIQLVQVPVFLHFWSVPLFGEWLILSSIPTYLGFSNIGFGSVAYNEMTMSIAAGDQAHALRVFQSCWWLIIALCSAVGLLLGIGIFWLPLADSLRFHEISFADTRYALLFLGSSVLFGQLEQLLGSAYTCVGRYPYGALLKNALNLAAFAVTMIAVSLHSGVRGVALASAAVNVCGTVFLCFSVRRDIPWIEYGWTYARFSEIKRLTAPALAFMGFPLGNALNLQGSLLAVGYALGPTNVVVFGTARTVSRVALQFIQMIGSTVWPELSNAYGARNWAMIRDLHRRSCQIALLLAVVFVSTMLVVGPWFLNHWTDGHVPPSRTLLGLLLLVVVLNSFWSTSSTLVVAINKHQSLAAYYVVATGLTLIVTYLVAKSLGLYGAAASLLVSELIMALYVLPNSLRISHDSLAEFLPSLLRAPPNLHVKDLFKRLRATKSLNQG